MEIKRVTVGGINGNGGREYRIFFLDGIWLSFDSMPGDRELYRSHKSSSCGLPDTPIALSIDQHAKQARELLVADVVGKYDQPTTIYFALKTSVGASFLYCACPTDPGGTIIQAQIDSLKAEKAELLEALEALRDEQNGPPLVKHADQWQAALDKATAILAKHNPQTRSE